MTKPKVMSLRAIQAALEPPGFSEELYQKIQELLFRLRHHFAMVGAAMEVVVVFPATGHRIWLADVSEVVSEADVSEI